jgi:hypothetical protein
MLRNRILKLAKNVKEKQDSQVEIINATPHDVNIMDEDENIIKTYQKGDIQIRLDEDMEKGEGAEFIEEETIDDVPVKKISYCPGDVPNEKENVYYIVSTLVAQAFDYRKDFLVPIEVVRDDDGNPIGCKALGRYGDQSSLPYKEKKDDGDN